MVKLLVLDEGGPPAAAPDHDIKHGGPQVLNDEGQGVFKMIAFFPIVSEIATGLDLTSLDQLSQTCRQIRVNLLQYRSSLMGRSLRCSRERSDAVRYPCARDLVGACQRCRRIYCRNCIVKPKHTSLSGRHRRMCKTCIKAPLQRLMEPDDDGPHHEQHAFFDGPTADRASLSSESSGYTSFSQGPCVCVESMWFCEPCERQLVSEDTTYMRGWSWRHRYSHTGVGIGEGEQGVPCGREGRCLAVREVEVEIDAEQFASPDEFGAPLTRGWSNSSYFMQEIEGIGGVVKKKVKKRVSVGHVVKEYEEERLNGDYLVKEQSGKVRSWCAHCNRVILGEKDKASVSMGADLVRVISSSASSSTSRGT